MRRIRVNRVEQTLIRPNHKMYNVINNFSIRSKNMYNYANWFCRQCFIREGYWLRYQEMQKIFKHDEPYKKLMSQSSQCVLQVLERSWKSYFNANKEYDKNPKKFLGKPKIPKYIKSDKWIWFLKNNNTYIKDGRLHFRLKEMQGYSFKTNVHGRLIAVRFVPRGENFILEIIYEKDTVDIKDNNNNMLSIDLGVDNFITMVDNLGNKPTIIKGGYIKAENQWYNKRRADMYGKLTDVKWSRNLDRIGTIRYNRIKNYMHHVSKYVIDYCKAYSINTIIVGLNKTWKQEIGLSKKVNQKFVFIPYDMLIKQLEYKCQDNGIIFITTEESYTSGTSVLDDELPIKDNYNKTRRIKRGLFKTNNGVLINSDVNGSMQIMRKVNPNAFNSYGLEGCLNPIIIKDIFSCYKLST